MFVGYILGRGYPPDCAWDLRLDRGGHGPVKIPIFDGFGDHLGIPPGSLFAHFSVKMDIFLTACFGTLSGEPPAPLLVGFWNHFR